MANTTTKQLTIIYFFSFLSGILMFFGWPTLGCFPFVFVGLVPLYAIYDIIQESNLKNKRLIIFSSFFLAHIIWIGGSLSWMYAVSEKTYFVAVILDALFFSLPFSLLLKTRKVTKPYKWIFFIAIWMSIEYLNQNWSLGSPYFTLGNGFGQYPWLIQSYEIIGIEGGSVFVLLVNLGLFFIFKSIKIRRLRLIDFTILLIGMFPFVLSLVMQPKNGIDTTERLSLAVLHTNFQSFTDDKHAHPEKVTSELLSFSSHMSNGKEELIVWPETIVPNLGWLSNRDADTTVRLISQFYKNKQPNFALCIGGYAFSVNFDGKEDPYAQFESQRNFYYNTHNIASTFNDSVFSKFRSKTIFVPFQERIPYLKKMPFLKYFSDVVGANTKVALFEKDDQIHETTKGNKFIPFLCYESIFPLFLAEHSEDVDFFVVLSNEYWNPNMKGIEQYLFSNVSMAIQSRIPIARSSNGGISAIIDKNGQIVTKTSVKKMGLIHANVDKKTNVTIYESIHGMFYILSVFVIIGLVLSNIYTFIFYQNK